MSNARNTVIKMNNFDGTETTETQSHVYVSDGTVLKTQSLAVFKDKFGTADSSLYADLAEKYEPDAVYEEGMVLAVGGSNEVTKYTNQNNVAGIVSFYPAFKMNEGLEDGVYIALKGKVPCKINGSAIKGQFIIADSNGFGKAVDLVENYSLLLGIALEDSINNKVMVKV